MSSVDTSVTFAVIPGSARKKCALVASTRFFQLDKRLLLMEVFGDCSIIGASCRLCAGGPIQLKERLR